MKVAGVNSYFLQVVYPEELHVTKHDENFYLKPPMGDFRFVEIDRFFQIQQWYTRFKRFCYKKFL